MMKIVVLAKLVPDLVEELTIDPGGQSLDTDWLRLVVNEFDHHAIEQAILLKEKHGGQVTVIVPDAEGADEILYSAAATGADRLIKLIELPDFMNNRSLACGCVPLIREIQPELILTGVQAHDDLDGQIGPLMAEFLGFPYAGYISGVTPKNGHIVVDKEFPGGLVAEMEMVLPAVVGIQAADEPPRYVAFSRIRQARSSASIEEISCAQNEVIPGPSINRMYHPEIGEKAEMIAGTPEEIAAKLIEIFKEKGIV